MKDERLVSKMEGKTNFSRHLKQFDVLIWQTVTPSLILRQMHGTAWEPLCSAAQRVTTLEEGVCWSFSQQ